MRAGKTPSIRPKTLQVRFRDRSNSGIRHAQGQGLARRDVRLRRQKRHAFLFAWILKTARNISKTGVIPYAIIGT